MPALKVRLFGTFQVWRNDTPIAADQWPAGKLRDLLKVLITARDHVEPAERLVETFWPDLAPASAANSLHVTISKLRRVLQPDLAAGQSSSYIVTSGDGYLFPRGPDIWIDVDVFLAAVAHGQAAEQRGNNPAVVAAYDHAIELYRGAYLEENPYDDWAIGPRARLEETYLELLERAAAVRARLGQHRSAIDLCHRALALDGLRESVCRVLMICHYRLGQRDLSVRAYERCRAALVDELGIDPMPETLALYEHILRDELPDDAGPGAAIAARSFTGTLAVPAAALLPLVGRNRELAVLQGQLDAAAEGAGRFLLVTGEAGIGKTRLVAELRGHAEAAGMAWLAGRCYELERTVAYGPVCEAIRSYLVASILPADGRRQLRPFMVRLAALMPDLDPSLPKMEGPPGLIASSRTAEATQPAAGSLLSTLAGFLLALSTQQPLVLFLDDLQWADRSTLRLVHTLSRRVETRPLLVIAACRSEDVSAGPLADLETGLARERLVSHLWLSPLPSEAVVDLVARLAAPGWESAAFGRRLYQETEGNPLFIAEMLASLRETGVLVGADGQVRPARNVDLAATQLPLPRSISSLIAARLRAAGDAGTTLLRVAAVLGHDFTLEMLTRSTDLSADRLLDSLEDLEDRKLIQAVIGEERIAYRFSHDRFRETIYAELSPARRSHLHGRVARVLEEMYAKRPDDISAVLAHHYMAAGEPERAVEHLLRAGDAARTLYAHEEAIIHYRRALALLRDLGDYDSAARTAMKLSLSLQIGFDYDQAGRAYDEGFLLWGHAIGRPAARPALVQHALRVNWFPQVRSLDPALVWDSLSTGVVDQLFSGLVEQGPGLEPIPDIAFRWEVAGGGRQYRFHLRDDVSWSDGRPVTAHDFDFAWKRLLDPHLGSPLAAFLADVKGAAAYHDGEGRRADVGIRAVDDTTLVIELSHPIGYFPHLLAHNATFPVPRHLVQALGAAWTEPAHLVTNGAFRLLRWEPGRLIHLERNLTYHGRFEGNAAAVDLRLAGDPHAALEQYERDELDILRLIEYESPHALVAARARHAGEDVSLPRLHTSFLGFDTTRPPFNDPRVRAAFAMTADQETLAEVALLGVLAPALGGFIPPGLPGHTPALALPFDPVRAAALLAEAGYAGGQGLPGIIAQASLGGLWQPMRKHLRATWQEHLNVVVDWQSIPAADLIGRLEAGNPPNLFVTGWYADYPDPHSFLSVCPLRQMTNWTDTGYQDLISAANSATDQGARLDSYRHADRLLVQSAAIVPLTYGREHLLVKPRIKRLPSSMIRWWLWKDVVLEDA